MFLPSTRRSMASDTDSETDSEMESDLESDLENDSDSEKESPLYMRSSMDSSKSLHPQRDTLNTGLCIFSM